MGSRHVSAGSFGWVFRLEHAGPACYFCNVVKHAKYRENAATTALLIDDGIALMRENLRRRHPAVAPAEIEGLLRAWLDRRDDALPGDTAGAVRVRSRAP
jgi:hypothetical protein